jgi:enamine deaminase RidA (YjgF/YER057c/UK114 family)
MNERTGTVADRLARLGLQLPPPPAPVATFEPYVRHGSTIYTSGQIATWEGHLVAAGWSSSLSTSPCTGEFTQQPQVADGASQLMLDVLGAAGAHAHPAVGVAALPVGSAIEVEAIAQVSISAADEQAQRR